MYSLKLRVGLDGHFGVLLLVKTYKRWYATTEDFGVLIIDADHRFQVKGVYFDF